MKKLFTLAAAILASVSLTFAADKTNVGTYSTQVVSSDGLTSTWTFITPSSQTNVPTGETTDVDIIYAPSGSSKMKFSSGNGFSWSGSSDGYIYVPAGGAGTITMTVKGSSDTRWLQLYVNGEAAADSKRLWSKYAETAGDGKKGPQSFTFTADDLTTKGGKTYLHFKDNNTEMKIASFSITLTAGTYADCAAPINGDLEVHAGPSTYTGNYYAGQIYQLYYMNGNGNPERTLKLDGVVIKNDSMWEATVGEHTLYAEQPAYTYDDVKYCEQTAEFKFTVHPANPVTKATLSGPTSGYKGQTITLTVETDEQASSYLWYDINAFRGETTTNTKTFTLDFIGTQRFYVRAKNQFNAESVESNVLEVVITELCDQVLIHYDLQGGSKTNVAVAEGALGGIANENTESKQKGKEESAMGYKLGSNGHFVSLQLNGMSFQADDVVKVFVCQEQAKDESWTIRNALAIASDKDNTHVIGEVSGITTETAQPVEITLTEDAEVIYLSRNATISQNPVVKYIEVYRPCNDGKPVFNIDKTSIELNVTASNPSVSDKVVFSGKNLTPGTYNLSFASMAAMKVNPTSVTVGDNGRLNAEITVTYTNNVEVAANSTVIALTVETASGPLAKQFTVFYSSVQAKTYISKNVNIEQAILDYGTKYDYKAALTAAGWEYENLNDLDTLNDIENKTNRNYDFLGLKIKTSGAYVAGWLQADGLLLVKFGSIGGDIKVSVKGATTDATQTFAKADLWNEDDQAYVLPIYGFTEDVYVKIETTSGSTVVLKQLMIDELAKVTLPAPGAYLVTCAEAENGKVEATWTNKKYRTPVGATVTLTVTPAENYKVVDVKVNGISLNAVENVYSFTMPAEDVTVTATFELDSTVGIEDTEASVKAVKFFQNGQLFIEKNGKVYTITGSEIR